MPRGGQPNTSDTRLFMQFQAFGGAAEHQPLVDALQAANIPGVLYLDANDPRGVGLVTFTTDPNFFVESLRPLLLAEPFTWLTQKPEFTMMGRTYAIGYERDLEEVLLNRPKRHVLNPDWPWAVWYPLRRSGRFAQLLPHEQKGILKEHGDIGMSFGGADLAHDVRLACHGLDKSDNDFVIGLIGKELFPLSAVVQTMRGTKQTSQYLERLGPFFVGKAVWQNAG